MTSDGEDRSVLTRSAPTPDRTMPYGTHADQVIDIYRPSTRLSTKRLPVLLIHGGFWRPEYDRSHARVAAAALAAAGWQAALPEYRRIPGQPDVMVGDVLASIEAYLETTDASTAILIGHSAGGHLALLCAIRLSLDVAGVLALAPVSDLIDADQRDLGDGAVRAFLGTAPTQRPDLNVALLSTPTCSTTVLHGVSDSLVPVEMSRSYGRRAGIQFVPVDNCAHFELIDPLTPAWQQVLMHLATFTQES